MLARADTVWIVPDGRIQTKQKWFVLASGEGEVCATVTVCFGDTCTEQEACLPVSADSLAGSKSIRTGHVVRHEVVADGKRYRADGPVWVPIQKSERLLDGEIRICGQKASVVSGPEAESTARGGTMLNAIVCVDSTGAVTRILPGESIDDEAFRKLTDTIHRMNFAPGAIDGRHVADWLVLPIRIN